MKYIPSIPLVKTRFGFPLLPKILSILLLFLGMGLLRAETSWDVYASETMNLELPAADAVMVVFKK